MDVEDLPYAMDTIDTIRMRSSPYLVEPRGWGWSMMAIWLANCALSAWAVMARPTHASGGC